MIRAFGKMLTMATALAGGLAFSQAPEFTQQYRQRIGGALDELNVLITQFDRQARRQGLDREAALDTYSASPQVFLQEQGRAMRGTFTRYDTLLRQQRALSETPPLAQPLIVIRNPDTMAITNAWEDFSPAVPVNVPGLVWAGAGLIAGWIMAFMTGLFGRGVARVWRRPNPAQEAASARH